MSIANMRIYNIHSSVTREIVSRPIRDDDDDDDGNDTAGQTKNYRKGPHWALYTYCGK